MESKNKSGVITIRTLYRGGDRVAIAHLCNLGPYTYPFWKKEEPVRQDN